jgi:hypothetical protein
MYCDDLDMGRVGVEREKVRVSVRGRKTSSKDCRRAPLVRRDISTWEGTMRCARARSWPRGRMQRANVSW